MATPRRPGMIDATDRVSGRIPYTIDVSLPGMLHARLVRSTAPHARIVSVDTTRARALQGVVSVLTADDLRALPGVDPRFGPVLRDQPVLADGVVRFVGEPVAIVIAEELDAAIDAAGLVEVEYEQLAPIFDPRAALEPDAPVLHADALVKSRMFFDVIVNNRPGTNVCNHFKIRKGDAAAAMRDADLVFEDEFHSPSVQHVPLETHACLATFAHGRLTCWSTTQTPFVVRAQLAEVFGLSQTDVRVIVPTLGGGYGAKTYPHIEPIVAAAALVTGRPVRLHLTRAEEFVTVTKHEMVMTMRTGLTRDGVIVAREVTGWFNTGAYADIGPRLIMYGALGTCGPYRIPNLSADTYAVYTNVPPAGAFRGYGISQAAWAHESHMDMIAERIGMDALELRRRNLLVDGDTFSTGDQVSNTHLRKLLDDCASAIDWHDEPAVTRDGSRVTAKGLGLVAWRALPLAVSTASVKLNDDGTVHVLTSSVEMGQGLRTALAILTSEALGIPVERVSVSLVDTDLTPYDQQTSASRSTYAMGGAVVDAVGEIRRQLLDLASEQLEVAATDLEVVDGWIRPRGVPERAVEVGDVVRTGRVGNLYGFGRHRAKGALDPETGQALDEGPGHWHQAAGAAEVEVDLETGSIRVVRYHGAVFAGRIVNPVQAELQTEGGITFGLGQALFEEMIYDNGQLQNGNLGDYMIPSILDLPDRLSISVLEYPQGGEIHGIGEPSLPPVMPAVANAVYRAAGIRIRSLPLTPEKVLRALLPSDVA